MSIDRIYGGKGIGPIEQVKRNQQSDSKKAENKSNPQDRIEFSSVLQEVSKARETAASPAAARADKVAALKAQISSGEYKPDLEKVAQSMLKFMSEEK